MKYSSEMAREIHMALSMSKRLGSEVRVYGRTLQWNEYHALIRDAFGVNDNESIAAIGRKLNGQAADLCGNVHGVDDLKFRMNAYSADLLQHYGINPARLILAAHNVWPRAKGNGKSATLEIAPYAIDGAMNCKVKITLGAGVRWCDGKIHVNKIFPMSIAQGLVGRPLSAIVQDDWEGWGKMKIKNVSTGSKAACITTDQVANQKVMGFKAF